MTSRESGFLLDDFFATEVRLFRADVELTLRSGMCAPVAATAETVDLGEEPSADLGMSQIPATLPVPDSVIQAFPS